MSDQKQMRADEWETLCERRPEFRTRETGSSKEIKVASVTKDGTLRLKAWRHLDAEAAIELANWILATFVEEGA